MPAAPRKLLLALALAACSREPTGDVPATTSSAVPVAADAWIVEAVASLGERATFVIVVHAGRWPALHTHLTAFKSADLVPDLLVDATDPARLPELLLTELLAAPDPTTRRPPLALDLALWDRGRPLIAALADVALDGPVGTLGGSLTPGDPPAMRHELLVPTANPPALAAALARGLAALGPARPDLVATTPGAHAWTLAPHDTLAVVPAQGLVRIILVQDPAPTDLSRGTAPTDLSPGTSPVNLSPGTAPPAPPKQLDPADPLADLSPRTAVQKRGPVDARPSPGDPADPLADLSPGTAKPTSPKPRDPADPLADLSPGTAKLTPTDLSPRTVDLSLPPPARATAGVVALAGDDAALVLVRPHRLPMWHVWRTAAAGATAFAWTIPGGPAAVRSATLRRIAGCERIWGAEIPEVEDYALALAGDDRGLHLRAVAGLTEHGAALVDAGTRARAMPLALLRPAVLDAWLSFDTAAATAGHAPIAPFPVDDPDFFHECEPFFAMYSPSAPMIGPSRLIAGFPEATATPASGPVGQLVVTDAAARQGGVAELLAAAVPQATLEQQYSGLAALVGAAPNFLVEPEGDRQRLRVGFNAEPRDLFGDPAPHDGLAHVHADLAAIAPLLRPLAPDLAAALGNYDRLAGVVRRSGRTIVAELAVATGEPTLRPHDLSAAAWDPRPADRAPRCAQDYARALTRLLRPFAEQPAPADLDAILNDLAGLDPALACLAADPARPVAALRAAPAIALADALVDRYRRADAERILSVACDAGGTDACRHRDLVRARPVPDLATVSTMCLDLVDPPRTTLAISPTGTTVDGVLAATPDALRTALRAAHDRDPARPLDLGLAIDRSIRAADLVAPFQILREHAAAGRDLDLTAAVRQADRPLPLHLALATPTLGDPAARLTDTDLLGGHRIDLRAGAITVTPSAPDGPLAGPLIIAPDPTSEWHTIAAAVARSCQDVAIVEPNRAAPVPPVASTRAGNLGKDIIRRIVRAHINDVRNCYTQALMRDPDARGRVVLHFVITGSGKVRDTIVTESTLKDSRVGTCIASAVARWTFPKPDDGGNVDVTYPFVLEPG